MASTVSPSSPAPTPAPSNSAPNENFIPATASPPLILAFLAIGIFATSMLGIFGWRRIRLRRLGAAEDLLWDRGTLAARRRRDIGERPKLWDFWSDPAHTVRADPDVGWDHLTPVAVVVIPDDEEDQDRNQDQAPHALDPVVPARFYRWTHSPAPPLVVVAPVAEKAGSAQPVHRPRRGTLSVAVAIAMPTPPGDPDGRLHYSLGLHERDGVVLDEKWGRRDAAAAPTGV